MPPAARTFIGLGSNLGARRATIRAAIQWLDTHPKMSVISCSSFMETDPWGVADQPRFINAVTEVQTSLSPRPLLDELKRAELELGRQRRSRWGPREIDLDILLYNQTIIDTPELTIPHGQLTNRRFVLVQLVELDDRLIDPRCGKSLCRILRELDRT